MLVVTFSFPVEGFSNMCAIGASYGWRWPPGKRLHQSAPALRCSTSDRTAPRQTWRRSGPVSRRRRTRRKPSSRPRPDHRCSATGRSTPGYWPAWEFNSGQKHIRSTNSVGNQRWPAQIWAQKWNNRKFTFWILSWCTYQLYCMLIVLTAMFGVLYKSMTDGGIADSFDSCISTYMYGLLNYINLIC